MGVGSTLMVRETTKYSFFYEFPKFDIISGNGVFANIIDANSGEDIVAKPACLICMWRQHSMCLKVWKFKFQNFSVERRRRWRERSDTGSCSV